MTIKICGLTRPEDVNAAIEAGADSVGFVREPASPRFASAWRELIAGVPSGCQAVAVYGPLIEEDRPDGVLVQAIDPGADICAMTLEEPYEPGPFSRAILLDAHVPGVHGGTGKTIDWLAARDFAANSRLPVMLAGGLKPENVAEAIRVAQPYGVDVSSGVEASPGIKDHGLVRAFIEAARKSP